MLVAKPKRNVGSHKGVALLDKKKNSKNTLNIIKFIKDFFYWLVPYLIVLQNADFNLRKLKKGMNVRPHFKGPTTPLDLSIVHPYRQPKMYFLKEPQATLNL